MAYLLHGSKEAAGNQVGRMFENDPVKGEILLQEICDHLFDVNKPFLTSSDFLDWLKVLFGGSIGFEAMCTKVRSFDHSSLCGCVWTAQFFAYRCRTCATSPCMSLCATCFENGNHVGHDYNVFRSEAGGACDCGDSSVMHSSGFCTHHGPNRVVPSSPPPGFLAAGKILFGRMILLLMQNLRQTFSNHRQDLLLNPTYQQYLEFLLEIIKLGSPVRNHVANLLLNESLYADLNQCKGYKCLEDINSGYRAYHKQTVEWFQEAVEETEKPHIMFGIEDTGQFKRAFEYKNFLDELTFWIVKYMFPESLILIILNLLPNAEIKREFSSCFARHYTRIADSLIKSKDLDPLTNRVVHISVQLFSNEDLAYMLCTEEHLLQIFVMSMHNILSLGLVPSETRPGDRHYHLSSSTYVLKSNVYWPIVSDLVNVLGHTKVGILLLNDENLFECWLHEIMGFCGMAVNKRALNLHVEFEPDSNLMLVPFYSEREACASPLWCLLALLQDSSSIDISYKSIKSILKTLQKLFDSLGLNTSSCHLPFNQVSYHYPLHRYLAHFVCNAVKNQGATISELSITEAFAKVLIAHPLQILVTTFEVQSAMWVRNGMHMASQTLALRQYFFSKFFIDSDLYMMQLCACILPPHYFLALLLERCRVIDCIQVSGTFVVGDHRYSGCDVLSVPFDEKLVKMFEAFFVILQYLLSINCLTDSSEEELIRSELICLLTVKPSTYSLLTDHTPQSHDTGSKNVDFTSTHQRLLKKYAVKNEGIGMKQTKYTPNSEAWKLYDPVFSHYRALYHRDLQKAHSNYFKHLQENNEVESSASESDLWPPYRPITKLPKEYQSLSNVMHSRLFHSLVFIVLHNQSELNESTLCVVLHLLDTALRLRSDAEPPVLNQDFYDQTWCQGLLQWYGTDDILQNMVKIVSFREPIDLDENQDNATSNAEKEKTMIYTGECIVSLLVKLHFKFNDNKQAFNVDQCTVHPPSFLPSLPPTRVNVLSNILSMASYKSKEIQQMIRIVGKTLMPHPSSSDSQVSAQTSLEAREQRRMKAKEARDRLMREFALKQKEFLETTNLDDVTETNTMNSESNVNTSQKLGPNPNDWGLESFPTYECVICGSTESELQTHPPDNEDELNKVMGIICLAQPSSVLSHRSSSEIRLTPYMPGERPASYDHNSWRSYVLKRCRAYRSLINTGKLEEDVFAEQNLFATAVGTHLTTCGHHVHLACHTKYMQSMMSQGRSHLNRDMKLAFRCPLCRQVSNFILPCNIRKKQKNCSNYADRNFLIRKTWIGASTDIEEIVKADSLGAHLARSSKNLGLIIPLSAIVRYNLECLLMLDDDQSRRSISSASPSSRHLGRKHPIGLLFVLLHCLSADPVCVNEMKADPARIQKIKNRVQGRFGMSLNTADTPLLIEDSVTLLIRLFLDCPMLVPDYQRCVHLVYNLVFVQSLLEICFNFSSEERKAWSDGSRLTAEEFSSNKLECIMAALIRSLPTQLFESSSTSLAFNDFPPTFFSTVFTTQSVYDGVEQNLLRFLKVCVILQNQVFPHMPALNEVVKDNDFGSLAICLGFRSTDNSDIDITKCLTWSDPKILINFWCGEITSIVEANCESSRTLLVHRHIRSAPKLLDLPEDYGSLFQSYRSKPCSNCKTVLKDSALCLICGEFLCLKAPCDQSRHDIGDELIHIQAPVPLQLTRVIYSCTRHARRCGAGTCVFLQIGTSSIIVVRGTRTCFWGNIYLDVHGEEDVGWRRGRPLFLRRERLELLEQQWVSHLFDNTAKDWAVHQNLL